MADAKHNIFALGVPLLSIAITLSGMAIVVDRPLLWHVGIVFGVAGSGLVRAGDRSLPVICGLERLPTL